MGREGGREAEGRERDLVGVGLEGVDEGGEGGVWELARVLGGVGGRCGLFTYGFSGRGHASCVMSVGR